MVITLDKHKRPLGFCTERRARILLSKRRACVYRYYPFTIIVKDVDARNVDVPEYRIKIDPGAKHTGIAVVWETDNAVMAYFQIEHRGDRITKHLETRHQARRNRRQRETRYRRCKWINHYLPKNSNYKAESPRPEGWLPPSVKSTSDNIISWVKRLCRLVNIRCCSFEAVRFDTQLLDNPDINGVEYQQGTLFGYEVKEYLLDKYGHTCQYCGGVSGDPILEWEHIHPRSKGGSDSMKNATLACHTCNQDKDDLLLSDWLDREEALLKSKTSSSRKKLAEARVKGIRHVLENKPYKVSNRYCAWVSSTRRHTERGLFDIFGTVECSSGGRTKLNRETLNLPKDHHYDALCVGSIPEAGYQDRTGGYCLYFKAMGRGSRFRGKVNQCGIITVKVPKGPKRKFGFQNGDIVVADVPKGKYAGHHVGRVMTRTSGSFDVRCADGKLVTVNQRHCSILQRNNGYQFHYGRAIPLGT